MNRPDTAPVHHRSLPQWPLLIVVAGVLLGLGVAWIGPNTWRLGCLVIGSALGIGAVMRIALPDREAGLLQVRSRAFDIMVLAVGGAAIIAWALAVPGRR